MANVANGTPLGVSVVLVTSALVPWGLACEQVADSNNGEEHRLQFEPADARPLAVGLGASVDVLAADPDGSTCFALAGDCVPTRLPPVEIRSASCAMERCGVRIEAPGQVVVLGSSPGEDRLEVEACFPKLGCVTDRRALTFETVDQIRIDCLDDACPGPATGVLVGSRVRTTVRLLGEIAAIEPIRIDPWLTSPRLPGAEPVAAPAASRATVEVPVELRATEGIVLATEGEVPLEVATVQGRVLELVLRPTAPGRAVLVASVGDTRQRFDFEAIAASSVSALRLRVADAVVSGATSQRICQETSASFRTALPNRDFVSCRSRWIVREKKPWAAPTGFGSWEVTSPASSGTGTTMRALTSSSVPGVGSVSPRPWAIDSSFGNSRSRRVETTQRRLVRVRA